MTHQTKNRFVICAAFALVTFGIASTVEAQSWKKKPGPIAGVWQVSCADSAGMQITVRTPSPKRAIGYVSRLGKADQYGYRLNEVIFDLRADDYGDWVGKLRWRSVYGANRWDPIRLVATPTLLNATMTTDRCYTNMRHAVKRRGS